MGMHISLGIIFTCMLKVYFGKQMIVRGCFSYGSGSRLRVGEDLEFTATNYLMIIKQTPKLIRSHVLGLTGVTD